MKASLLIKSAGPGVTVQDKGRPGNLALGLSRGGAIDQRALAEGAALLGQSDTFAAIEMAMYGGVFQASSDLRIALSGAPMAASIDERSVPWNASHCLPEGANLTIGSVRQGSYGYLHVGGGIDTALILNARSAHLGAGIGSVLRAGDYIPVGEDNNATVIGQVLTVQPRWDGGMVRILPSLQTAWFDSQTLKRFETTVFKKDTRANRMGARLLPQGEGFTSDAGLSVLSEVIVPGDIQITGDGIPFVLLSECQTTGGYPRIGSVLPSDIPLIAQAGAGCEIRFRFVTIDEAMQAERKALDSREALPEQCRNMLRNPRDIDDLLSYQLISGVVSADG